MLDIKSQTFLTKEQIKEKANSIFATKGAHNTSEKYAHIPTHKIIEDMEVLGWKVTDVKQVKSRGANAGFQKHLVVFRNTDITINGSDGDSVFPSILLTNSSDGKNAFTFKASIFRLICENGLIISEQDFVDMRIRHFGYDFSELQKTITLIIEKLPLTVESMNKFKQIQLTDNQIIDFAKKALQSRFGENETKRITIDYTEFIKPTRKEDEGNGLWEVYNRIQEKLIHGDFNYGYSTKTRKARRIKNFQQDIKINEDLWSLAKNYVN
jgi:hypothetical protein